MTNTEPPKIEFPCAYPLKIIGHAADDFSEFVIAVLERHTDRIYTETIELRPSSAGRYVSVRVTITATGEEQLKNIFTEFKASGRVHTVI